MSGASEVRFILGAPQTPDNQHQTNKKDKNINRKMSLAETHHADNHHDCTKYRYFHITAPAPEI